MSERNIIIAPVITEKSTVARTGNNCYTFKVSVNANKIEIKKAIEKIFSVNVVSVNTVLTKGKLKRRWRNRKPAFSKKPDMKKAIVKLRDGQSIPDFEL